MKGEQGDIELAKKVLGTVLKQHTWVRKRMMRRASELLAHARLTTQKAVSQAVQEYNARMKSVQGHKGHGKDVEELGESESVAVAAKSQMMETESVVTEILISMKKRYPPLTSPTKQTSHQTE